MANKARGEVKIKLAGVEYSIAPEFETLVEIEDMLGYGLPAFLQRIVVKLDPTLKQVATVVYCGLKASGDLPMIGKHPAEFKQIGEMVMKDGINQFIVPVMKFVANALSSSQEEVQNEKKVEAEPQALPSESSAQTTESLSTPT